MPWSLIAPIVTPELSRTLVGDGSELNLSTDSGRGMNSSVRGLADASEAVMADIMEKQTSPEQLIKTLNRWRCELNHSVFNVLPNLLKGFLSQFPVGG